MAIDPLVSGGASPAILPATRGASRTPGGFFDAVERLSQASEQANTGANTAIADMLEGTGDVHDAMIALQRADLTLQLTMQVRNKLVQAYQEIMRMPV